jgi:L-2-hydroxycarboxylate dehydrogenase (NAD+)
LDHEHIVFEDPLREFTGQVLRRVGMGEEHARDGADALVWASVHGVDTHGIRNLKVYYVNDARGGRVRSDAQFRIDHQTPISARVDGDRGLGLAAAAWSMRLAIAKAAECGVGLVSVHNSNHFGAAGYYSQLAARHDMIGVSMTGFLFAEGTEKAVLPLFGARPMLSTNPLSFAFPCETLPPFLLDMATSVVPINRIEMLEEVGKPLPAGWALDANGRPTTDPKQARLVLPLGGGRDTGGHKGYGLALVVQALTGVLSGAWGPLPEQGGMPIAVPKHARQGSSRSSLAPQEVYQGPCQKAVAHFLGAIRLDLFRDPVEFKRDMDSMLRTLQRSPPAEGHERVLVPGQLEFETAQVRRRTGIPLPRPLAQELLELSHELDVPLPLERV